MATDYDVIVVGGGTMGLSAAYYLARTRQRVLLLEGLDLFNARNASHGDSRMFRIMYSDPNMARLAQAADPLWRELEEAADEPLRDVSGGCLFYGIEGRKEEPEGDIAACETVMTELGIPYTKYDNGADLMRTFPVLKNVPEAYVGLFQADGGPIYAARTLQALARMARQQGAQLRDREPTVKVIPTEGAGGLLQVITTKGTYLAEKLVLTPGAWANSVLASFGVQISLQIWEVTTAFYQVQTSYSYPIWICFGEASGTDQGVYYGFPPILGADRVKIGLNFTRMPIYSSPDQRTYRPDDEGLAFQDRFVARTFNGLNPRFIRGSEDTCTFNMTVDNQFVLDFLPANENVVLFAGDCGNAFKHTPVIGTILAQLTLTGQTQFDISGYKITRPGVIVNATPPGVVA